MSYLLHRIVIHFQNDYFLYDLGKGLGIILKSVRISN